MVGEAVQQSPGQAFRAEYLRPLSNGKLEVRAPLVALAEDFQQLLRERHEAESSYFASCAGARIPGLHQFMNQGSGREEADIRPPEDRL